MVPVIVVLGFLVIALGVLVIIQMKKIQEMEEQVEEKDQIIEVHQAKEEYWKNEYIKLSLGISNTVKNGK